MKSGANVNDINRIREMHEEGMDIEEMSVKLQIDPKCIASFVPGGKIDDDVPTLSEE